MKRWNRLLCMMVLLLVILPIGAFADMGPKPSVTVTVAGLQDEICYATLLSNVPEITYYAVPESVDAVGDEDTPQAVKAFFFAYADVDGHYFVNFLEDVSQSHTFTWGYWPPDQFKVLLYFPEYNSVAVAQKPDARYVFDSYFKVTLSEDDMRNIHAGDASITLQSEKDYPIASEVLALLARICATILVELLIALCFGFRSKKQLVFFAKVNVVTQVLLNVTLNIRWLLFGEPMIRIGYIELELLVFWIESRWYQKRTPDVEPRRWLRSETTRYAFIANLISFWVGLWLANVVPQLF